MESTPKTPRPVPVTDFSMTTPALSSSQSATASKQDAVHKTSRATCGRDMCVCVPNYAFSQQDPFVTQICCAPLSTLRLRGGMPGGDSGTPSGSCLHVAVDAFNAWGIALADMPACTSAAPRALDKISSTFFFVSACLRTQLGTVEQCVLIMTYERQFRESLDRRLRSPVNDAEPNHNCLQP